MQQVKFDITINPDAHPIIAQTIADADSDTSTFSVGEWEFDIVAYKHIDVSYEPETNGCFMSANVCIDKITFVPDEKANVIYDATAIERMAESIIGNV